MQSNTAYDGFPQPQYAGSSNSNKNIMLIAVGVVVVAAVVILIVLLSNSSSSNNNPTPAPVTNNDNNKDKCEDVTCSAGSKCVNGICQATTPPPTTDRCEGVTCSNGGSCVAATGACKCTTNWQGETCDEKKPGKCDNVVCQNNGKCQNATGACKCSTGYTGTFCETAEQQPEDPCKKVTCQNNGQCANGTCKCPAGFSGADCGTADQKPPEPCASSPCKNSGTCTASGTAKYTCACKTGYTGNNCETAPAPVDKCAGVNCSSHGKCNDTTGKCVCDTGYSGDNCEKSSDTCTKGSTKGENVLFIGESFIQMSTIPEEVAKKAVAAGSLASGQKYYNYAVSGKLMSGSDPQAIPAQYAKAVKEHPGVIKYVMMDGGGNDCLQGNLKADVVLGAARPLFKKMAEDKVEKIIYFFYPDPVGGSFGSLKTCLDAMRPEVKKECDGMTSPKCFWIDLRTTWNGHNDYTSDGIHPTTAGSVATAGAIWQSAVANCVAQ